MLCDNGGHTFNPKTMSGLTIGRFWKFSFHLDSSGIGIFSRDQKLIITYQCAQINSARFLSINLEAAKMAFSSALENREHNSVSEIESVSGSKPSQRAICIALPPNVKAGMRGYRPGLIVYFNIGKSMA